MKTVHNQTDDKQKNNRFQLTGCQDVRVANELHRNLIAILNADAQTTLDCTGVDSFDAAALQLLLAAKREAPNMLAFVAPIESEAATWFRLAGVNDLLQPEPTAI